MTIRKKLTLLLMGAIIALIIVGGIGLRGIFKEGESLDVLGDNYLPSVTALLTMKEAVTDLSRANTIATAIEETASLDEKRSVAEAAMQQKRKALQRFNNAVINYEKISLDSEEKALWASAKSALDNWLPHDNEVSADFELALPGLTDESFSVLLHKTREGIAERVKLTNVLAENLNSLVDYNGSMSSRAIEDSHELSKIAMTSAIATFLIATLLLIGFGWFVLRSVMKPIELCRATMLDITQSNNLTQRIDYQSTDEMGELIQAVNDMLGKMQESLRSIQADMRQADVAASSLAASAGDVAQSAAQQSNSSASMAAAIEEMTVSITTVSDGAQQTHLLADESEKISIEGGQIIDQTATEMTRIAESVVEASRVIESLGQASQQISAVVQVIKEVADQTNLLALNAAIEAARAGEQGRGFAVVADEVRKLAERTTSSTSEISSMIEKIQQAAGNSVNEMQRVVKQVELGQTLAKDAGERIHGIRDAAHRVTNAVTEISVALKEQSSASTEIAQHVEQIAQMSDKNLVSAEETAETARQVGNLSKSVVDVINRFKV